MPYFPMARQLFPYVDTSSLLFVLAGLSVLNTIAIAVYLPETGPWPARPAAEYCCGP